MGYISTLSTDALPYIWEVVGNAGNLRATPIAGTWSYTSIVGNGWSVEELENPVTHAQNDAIALGSFFVPEQADYTAYVHFSKDTDRGELHLFINGVNVGSIDQYAGATAYNEIDTITIASLTKGAKEISIKAVDKNAASSSYIIGVQTLVIAKD